jgi:hypothetical protein
MFVVTNPTTMQTIKLYHGFLVPTSIRVFSLLLGLTGIYGSIFTPAVGIPLILIAIIPWIIFEDVSFDVAEKKIIRVNTMAGLKIKHEVEKVEPNHIAFQRGITSHTLSGVKGVAAHNSSDYFYTVLLIYNHTKKETLLSVNDYEEAWAKTKEAAKQLGVKIFYAAATPQKWVDPVTGEEKIAELKKRR